MRASLLVTLFALSACGSATGSASSSNSPTATSKPTAATATDAGAKELTALTVTFRPVHEANAAHVHVSIVVPTTVRDALEKVTSLPTELRAWRGVDVHFTNLTASDDRGALVVTNESAGFTLNRARFGALHVDYDVPASTIVATDPRVPVVLEDRFRGAGERLLLLPTDLPRASIPIEVAIDGSAILAPAAASTATGVGKVRRTDGVPGRLLYETYVAGSLGTAVFDGFEHDEAAWLGYTAFDARGVTAEIAEIRSALEELFDTGTSAWTTLFLAQSRPLGSFSTFRRAGGVVVELGPSEPWSAPLRLAITHEMVRQTLGGALRFASNPLWFDGVARFEATRALVRLGRLTPDEAKAIVTGEMSIALTSPYRRKSNSEVAAKVASDPSARAVLVARGALYALRLNARLKAKKPASSLDALLLDLLVHHRKESAPASVDIWTDALSAALGPSEVEAFRAGIDRGEDPAFAAPAPLGPCFRVVPGTYAAFDLGFDETATLAATPRAITGLEAKGPAAKAGIQEGDVLLSLEENGGDHPSQIGVVVTRAGKEIAVDYDPKGATQKGPLLVRVPALRDGQCGETM